MVSITRGAATPRASAVEMLRRTRGRRRAITMSTAVASSTTIASEIETAPGSAKAAKPTATSAIAARGDGLMRSRSSGNRNRGDRSGACVVGGVTLELGFRPELEPVTEHGRRDGDDIVRRHEVAARDTRRGLRGREEVD